MGCECTLFRVFAIACVTELSRRCFRSGLAPPAIRAVAGRSLGRTGMSHMRKVVVIMMEYGLGRIEALKLGTDRAVPNAAPSNWRSALSRWCLWPDHDHSADPFDRPTYIRLTSFNAP